MVRMVDSGFSIFPEAMHKADNGMINIPTVIEVRAVRCEARYRLCGTVADSCEGEQPEEEKALHPISLIQQEEKDLSLKKRSSLSVTIL